MNAVLGIVEKVVEKEVAKNAQSSLISPWGAMQSAFKKTEVLPQQKSPQPGDILCAGSGFPELVVVPGGSFQMGSTQGSDEQPVHTVHIASFALGKYPVTQEQWKKVMGSYHRYPLGKQYPVSGVGWDSDRLDEGVQEFIQKLNQQTGHIYRLPSEAEWEYACRAGSTGQWCFGDDESQLTHYAWYEENSGGQTHPVGEKKANAFGLYDMHGNVWEWCEDVWHDDYQDAPSDGRARVKSIRPRRARSYLTFDDTGLDAVLRGGNYLTSASDTRSASRKKGLTSVSCTSICNPVHDGFRLARTLL